MFNARIRARLCGAAVLASALLTTTPSALAQSTTLTMSSWVPPTHFIVTDILQPWMEQVKQATNGRVQVNLLPKAVGAPDQHWELARRGVADITWSNFTYEPERFKSMWFAELPLMGDQSEAASVALWRTYEKFLAENPTYRGVKVLGTGMLGGGHIHHPTRATNTLEAMRGQKVRMGGPIQKRLLEEMGAIPVAGAASRAYEMLSGGVIDASLNPMESVVNFRLDSVLKNHTVIPDGLYDGTFFIAMNEGKWRRLSTADQQAIMRVSGETLSRLWGQKFDQQSRDAVAKMRVAGHQFHEPSRELMNVARKVRGDMLQELNTEGPKFGVPNHNAMVAFYEQQYKTLKK
jgi:TRAP-type C4-dicarboxylate transport system substrate-binding protein